MSILVSVADRQAYVYRNGVEIGTAGAGFTRPQEPLLPGVFILLDKASGRPDPLHPGQQLPVWHEIAVGRAGERSDVLDRLELPTAFAQAVLAEVRPGTTLDVTLAPAGAETRTGPGFTIAASQPA
jgi:hypothetical protein